MLEAGIKDEEMELLVSDLLDVWGYDFSDYSRASLKRRMSRLFTIGKFPSFAEWRYKLRTDPQYLRIFVEGITVNVTEMFRDPSFYKVLREEIIPMLATQPLIRIWHAGCSTGEEVYSMAIMLQEANVLHKSLLYATDINQEVLEKAGSGIFPLSNMKQYSENYIGSGGKKDFSSYYTANYTHARFHQGLAEKMIFANHNLVSDRSFNAFHLVICRNVLIYFDKDLQDRVLKLFHESTEPLGYLALGAKETLKFSTVASQYIQAGKEKIWRKKP